MSIVSVLFFLLIVVAVAWVAFWLIDSSLPEPMRMIAKVIVGVIALVVLLQHFVPGLNLAV